MSSVETVLSRIAFWLVVLDLYLIICFLGGTHGQP